jgi:nitroreductase/Pyruvate/2-oxoacid:ferredoxin oxidoreductase delta subunit
MTMEENGKTSNKPTIHSARCTGCGLCVLVCPSDTLSLSEGKAAVTGSDCIGCDQCGAVCPEEAVSPGFADLETFRFSTIAYGEGKIFWNDFGPADLVSLMHSRRSCRNFSRESVSKETLEDLIRIGITAPSGTNSQMWSFTVLPSREAVEHLGTKVADFYRHLNRMAENRLIRILSRFIMRNTLDEYYRRYYGRVKKAIEEWESGKRDRLFHGAPAVIVIGSAPGASCPAEDGLLAAQNILLGAHAMGLGTCLIGFAVEALKRDSTIKRAIGIPDEEKIHMAIAIGKPAIHYRRPAGRRKPKIRYV